MSDDMESTGQPEQPENTELNPDELEELLAGLEPDEPLGEADIDAVLPQGETTADADMETVIGPDEGTDELADQSAIDDLIDSIGGPEASEPATEQDAPARQAREQEAESVGAENVVAAATAPEEEEAMAGAQATQEVLEDLAARTPPPEPETKDTGRPAAASAEELERELGEPGTETPPPEMDEAELGESETAGAPHGPSSRAFDAFVRENFARLTLAAAVGLTCALGAFITLYANREQEPDLTSLASQPDSDLQRTVRASQSLIDQGRYAAAKQQLDQAIAKAPPSPDRVDATFAAIEAGYRILPKSPLPRQTEALHIAMDDFVALSPWDPRSVQVLRWKADVFERTDMAYSARDVYKTIIGGYGTSPDLDSVLLSAGKLAILLDRTNEAVDYLERLLRQFPQSPLAGEGKLTLGQALVAAGRPAEGRRLLLQIARAQPNTEMGAEAYARLAQVAFDAGNHAEAIALIETRIENATTIAGNDRLYLLLARACGKMDQPRKAEAVLQELIDFYPDSEFAPEAFIELTRVLDALGRRKDAARLASQAVRRYPNDPRVLRTNAELLALTGKTRAAAESLVSADLAGAGDPRVLLDAGRYFRDAGDLKDAQKTFERLNTSYPSASEAFEGAIDLAAVFRDQGKPRKAIERLEDLDLISAGTPQQLPVLIALAELYGTLGFRDEAADAYAQVASVTTEPEMIARAAIALFEAGEWSDAFQVADRVDVGRLRDKTAYDLLLTHGQTLLKADSTRAVEKMEQAYEDYPSERTPEGGQALLEAYLATDRTARARILVKNLEDHVHRTPVDLPILQRAAVTWADSLYARGDFGGASEAYVLAIPIVGASNEQSEWARFQRANALLKLGEFDESIKLLDQVSAGGSTWAKAATVNADYARVEQRLRGITPTPAESGG